MATTIRSANLAKTVNKIKGMILRDLDRIVSADKEKIEFKIDGKLMSITRSYTFYDGGKFTLSISVDGANVWGWDWSDRHPITEEESKEVKELFYEVEDAMWALKQKRSNNARTWFNDTFVVF